MSQQESHHQAEQPTKDVPQILPESGTNRRTFIGRAAKTIVYVAPVVMLFRPQEARAGSGDSLITPG